MTAQVIPFASAVLRFRIRRASRILKGTQKSVPREPGPFAYTTTHAAEVMRQLAKPAGFRAMIRADAEQAVDELAREQESRTTCSVCGAPIGCRKTLAVKHLPHGVAVYCVACAATEDEA